MIAIIFARWPEDLVCGGAEEVTPLSACRPGGSRDP